MLFSCSNDLETIKTFQQSGEPDLATKYKDVSIFYSDSAKLQMKINADEMLNYQGDNERTEFHKNVEMYFYSEEGVLETTLQANKVIRKAKENQLEAFNDVVLINQNGETLNTEYLLYQEDKEELYTDKAVKITREKEVLWGEGLVSNANFTKYSIKKIKSQIPIE